MISGMRLDFLINVEHMSILVSSIKLKIITGICQRNLAKQVLKKDLTDRFSISCKRWEPPFLGFCWKLVPWGLLGSYLGVKNILSLSLLMWAWGHTLYFSLQCKINPMIDIAVYFLTRVTFIFQSAKKNIKIWGCHDLWCAFHSQNKAKK